MALEQIGYAGPEGSLQKGAHRNVIQSVGATRQLTAAESGSLCLMDRAAGVVYTLPTPVAGMQFEFLATVAVTSNAYKVITKTIASQFIVGGVITGDVTIATSGDYFEANGTTHVAISENGSTSGGLLGDRFTLTAISETKWAIHGVLHGAGTLIDPFTTS